MIRPLNKAPVRKAALTIFPFSSCLMTAVATYGVSVLRIPSAQLVADRADRTAVRSPETNPALAASGLAFDQFLVHDCSTIEPVLDAAPFLVTVNGLTRTTPRSNCR